MLTLVLQEILTRSELQALSCIRDEFFTRSLQHKWYNEAFMWLMGESPEFIHLVEQMHPRGSHAEIYHAGDSQ